MQTINYSKLDHYLNWLETIASKIEPDHCYSIDEQIIFAKTKRSGGVKQ